jgi:hypothetical protein
VRINLTKDMWRTKVCVIQIGGRCRFQWRRVECDLLDDYGVFIGKGRVIACDSMDAVLDDQLAEDVGVCIMCCLSIVSVVMTIWKWPLARTIFDGYFLRKHLVKYSEGLVVDDDEVRIIGVKKNNILFTRGNKAHVTLKVQLPGWTRFCWRC